MNNAGVIAPVRAARIALLNLLLSRP